MSTKELHYWAQLRLALTSGQWSAKYPARTPNGIALPWSELLRKFNKHCKGFRDVAEVASYTQALALLLAANSSDEDQDDQPSDTEYPLELGQECMLAEERLEEGRAGYEVLKGLNSSNYDSLHFALAYYAYALGDSEKCLAHLANVPELISLQNHIPSGSDAATTSTTTSHSLGVHVPTFSTTQSFSSGGGSFVTMADASAPEIRDGRAWALTETFRSICLKGFCQEKLNPSNPRVILTAYCASLPLFATLATMFSNSTSSTSNLPLNTKIFSQNRELWRWVERLLWRAIIVSSAISQEATPIPCEDVWTWLRHYSACSIYWPATFRTWHRSTISVIYLRATIIQHHPVHSLSPPPRKTENEKPWLHAARIVVNDYRAILGACSSFPSAGERNVRVEDFVDLCVGVWEAAGASGTGAGWVLDVLWWATRLTFNSHKVLRHMTRILHVSGDTKLARRTLLLYSQVVGKAYEAGQAPSSNTPDLDDVQDPEGAAADSDSDSDEQWVETLVYGARMLCRWAVAQPGIEGLKEAREAGVYIKKARARLRADGPDGIRLAARVDLAEGVWNFVMTLKAEVMDGPEGAEEKWVEIFSWVAAQRTPSVNQLTPRPSVEGSQTITETAPSTVASNNDDVTIIYSPAQEVNEKQDTLEPIPITISPATPVGDTSALEKRGSTMTKRSSSSIDRDTSKSKKMQQMLKNRVHQGRARVTTISRKIGHGVVRSGTLKRANSTPDFHAILRQTAYQASSIHSRRRISSFLNNPDDRTPTASPPPPLPDPPPPPPQERKSNWQTTHRDRLIADLWLMSASTFRRLGKIEQAKGAIQEAEVKDEDNPRVWVQLGLYYAAHQQQQQAMDAYQKALFIDPDDVSASVHFAGLLLNKHEAEAEADISPGTSSSNYVDLVAGMLGHLTRGNGWHVPEAWYYLAKAHGLQGRKRRERECLDFALALSANRGIREIGAAIGWCI
ncbi:hypothetical protein H0H93_011170 [Arthromyces matolae]|nr:hypothetical protein H0H93_011170 [Arthromyces matolae]